MAGSVLLKELAHAPHARALLPQPKTRTQRVVEDVFADEMTARLGTSEFSFLDGALVPKNSKQKIIRDTQTVMKELCLDMREADFTGRVAQIDDALDEKGRRETNAAA